MHRWKGILALTVAGVFVAGPALAQSAAPAGGDTPKPDMAKPEGMKSDTMKSDKMQLKSAQQALRDKGHDPGSIDGVMGPKTQAALKDFQKAQGLNETGRLDAETTAKLGVGGKTSQMDSTSPSASPRTAPGAAPRPEGGTAKDKQR